MTPAEFRSWRKSLGLTQQAAAEALGLTRRTVGGYERGEWPVPRVVELATITLALVPVGEALRP